MNWEKFKSLRLSEKLRWIFQYYGLTMAVAAAAILVGTVFLFSVFGPGDDYAMRVMILDDHLSADECRAFSEELGAILSGKCDITSYLESEENQKTAFTVRLLTDELDLVIAPEVLTNELLQNGYLLNAVELPADSLYSMRTHGGSEGAETAFYIGETARSKNADHISTAIGYFTGRYN